MNTFLCRLTVLLSVATQLHGSELTTQEIVSRMALMNAARATALHSYRGTRTYQVIYKGFPSSISATVVVAMQYIGPDKKKFTITSQQGSKLLVQHVIQKALDSEREASSDDFRERSAITTRNYDLQLVGNDNVDGRPCYVLKVIPKRVDKYLYEGAICVDTADFAIARIQAKPAKTPSFWISGAAIEQRNEKFGDFWFPATTRSTSHVRIGGNAVLTINYSDYQVTDAATVRRPVSVPDAQK